VIPKGKVERPLPDNAPGRLRIQDTVVRHSPSMAIDSGREVRSLAVGYEKVQVVAKMVRGQGIPPP
jgi:hypothetical protein